MSQVSFKPRSAWTDRYREPTDRGLFSCMTDEHRATFEAARKAFAKIEDLTETLEWTGIPWRWSFVYRLNGVDRAVAYLVPEPEKPLLVLPLTYDDIEASVHRRMPKFVRDGIVFATEVDRVRWSQWALTGLPQVRELTVLVTRKLAALAQ